MQQRNLSTNITTKEKAEEGFITVPHTFDVLKRMNDCCPHIIAKSADNVVGYALTMLTSFRNDIPYLTPMFDAADRLLKGKNYVVMEQICVDKNYRKKGVFKGMYSYYRNELNEQYDCLFTEVATKNQRSLQAHLSVGFKILQTQITDDVSWELINWDWS